MPFRPIDSRIPHTVRTEDPNVLAIEDFLDNEDAIREERERHEKEREQSSQTFGTAYLPETGGENGHLSD